MLKLNWRNQLVSGCFCLGVTENWAQNGLENSGENLFPIKTCPAVEGSEISVSLTSLGTFASSAQHVGTAAPPSGLSQLWQLQGSHQKHSHAQQKKENYFFSSLLLKCKKTSAALTSHSPECAIIWQRSGIIVLYMRKLPRSRCTWNNRNKIIGFGTG